VRTINTDLKQTDTVSQTALIHCDRMTFWLLNLIWQWRQQTVNP